MKSLYRTLALLLSLTFSASALADENLHGKWTGTADCPVIVVSAPGNDDAIPSGSPAVNWLDYV